ncbi:MAG: transglutaminase [Burkholderiales bacterium RIFCSPLOWO2_12_FULL_61_40]|nr:MAG: transglutaminase [Burkholderiales bacterium RIFCSPLOWO2_12_FULL_61_40]
MWVVLSVHSAINFDQLLASFTPRWGAVGMSRFNAWRDFVVSGAVGSDLERLKKVNEFFNRTIVFGDDAAVWGQSDYWATPLETLGRGTGDCEDFVIAKYYTLQMVGVTPEKLRLTYVYARTGSSAGAPTQAHMVLAYYARPDEEPLVLDNLISDVRLASRRPDLSPVFSFNSQGIFAGTSGKELAPAVGSGRLSRWEDLLKRVRAEGFQ